MDQRRKAGSTEWRWAPRLARCGFKWQLQCLVSFTKMAGRKFWSQRRFLFPFVKGSWIRSANHSSPPLISSSSQKNGAQIVHYTHATHYKFSNCWMKLDTSVYIICKILRQSVIILRIGVFPKILNAYYCRICDKWPYTGTRIWRDVTTFDGSCWNSNFTSKDQQHSRSSYALRISEFLSQLPLQIVILIRKFGLNQSTSIKKNVACSYLSDGAHFLRDL